MTDDPSFAALGRALERLGEALAQPLDNPLAVTAPTAVLIRPDGFVAWVGAGTGVGLREALTTWLGAPSRG